MKKNSEMLELIGHLQVIDRPLLSLYVTQSGDGLFLFYHLKRNEYYLTKVTPREVIAYLDEKLGLVQIYMESDDYLYRHRSKCSATTSDFVKIDNERKNELRDKMESFNMYDEVFGLDEIKVRHYLKDKQMNNKVEPHKELAYG